MSTDGCGTTASNASRRVALATLTGAGIGELDLGARQPEGLGWLGHACCPFIGGLSRLTGCLSHTCGPLPVTAGGLSGTPQSTFLRRCGRASRRSRSRVPHTMGRPAIGVSAIQARPRRPRSPCRSRSLAPLRCGGVTAIWPVADHGDVAELAAQDGEGRIGIVTTARTPRAHPHTRTPVCDLRR